MRMIKCRKCGKIVEATRYKVLCDNCHNVVKRNGVIAQRVCRSCGVTFDGGPRAWYCPDCREVRKKNQAKEAKERAKIGKTRKINSIDICKRCGCEYYVKSGMQIYCESCGELVVREKDAAAAKKHWKNHRNEMEALKKDYADNRKVCVVCGNPLIAVRSNTVTCSPECAEIRLRELRRRAEERRKQNLKR